MRGFEYAPQPERRLSPEAARYLERLVEIAKIIAWLIEVGPGQLLAVRQAKRQLLVQSLIDIGIEHPDDEIMVRLLELAQNPDVDEDELLEFSASAWAHESEYPEE